MLRLDQGNRGDVLIKMFKQGIQNGLVIKSKPEFNQSTSMQFNVKGILRTFVNTCTMAILLSTMTFCGEKKLLKKT